MFSKTKNSIIRAKKWFSLHAAKQVFFQIQKIPGTLILKFPFLTIGSYNSFGFLLKKTSTPEISVFGLILSVRCVDIFEISVRTIFLKGPYSDSLKEKFV
jgi:hypothetical protein